MASLAKLGRDSVVLDPFAGYGAIPKQVLGYFPYAMVLVSDLDRDRAVDLRASLGGKRGVSVAQRDALTLEGIPGATVDAIITDPPWGYYEEIEDIQVFYRGMFASFRRVLKPRGQVVLLSARKREAEAAAQEMGFPCASGTTPWSTGRRPPSTCWRWAPPYKRDVSSPRSWTTMSGWVGLSASSWGWSRRSSPKWR